MTAAKTVRVSAKSMLREAILAGKTSAAMLKTVNKKFPDGNADELHVRKYVNELFKEGAIDEETRNKYYPSGRKRPDRSGGTETAPKPKPKAKAAAKKTVAKKKRKVKK
jgi:hypothetical protein